MYDTVFPPSESFVDRLIRIRQREANRLRKKASKVARKSALQALAILRQVEHLEKLNANRRGRSNWQQDRIRDPHSLCL